MSDNLYETWGSDSEKDKVYNDINLDGYDGAVYRSSAYSSNRQTYIDVEPNRSVRPAFNRSDYDSFRPGEAIPARQKKIMGMCMAAYDRVGIIRNVIDLMSDFASQGLVLVHPNRQIEKFYRKWFSEINAIDRSERFLNYLYRCGNVVVQRRTAKLSKKHEQELKRAAGADIIIQDLKVPRREIPLKYDFLNPVAVDVADAGAMAVGRPEFYLNITNNTYQSLLNTSKTNTAVFKTLPENIQKLVQKGERKIPLTDNTFFYHYKKDDWLLWANPMIYAILDDIMMLEKMKLADLAALDGAISQVRLWTVGDFDQKIVPTKAGLEKIRNILASNVGGGTMDLVWGPELKFTESNSQVYKFLGSEKYQPVLTSIYAGLGIPPTLTGASGASGGYTNNYVSLKTLIERLEYGRQVLTQFWRQEIEYVRKTMGFRLPAEVHFDSIILSDEAAQKNLLIQLADRDIISQETLLERFREIPNIEKVRTNREERYRSSNTNAPKKASPFHNPHHKEDIAKIALTKDILDSEEYFDNIGLPHTELEVEQKDVKKSVIEETTEKKNTEIKDNGRPPNTPDAGPRKRRRVLPRSGEPTSATIWGIHAQDSISSIINPIVGEHFGNRDVRGLSKAQVDDLEYLKLCIFTGMKPIVEVTPELIQQIIDSNTKPSQAFIELSNSKKSQFNSHYNRKPSMSELRHIYAACFAELFYFWEK